MNNPVGAVVEAANAGDVDTIFVAGKARNDAAPSSTSTLMRSAVESTRNATRSLPERECRLTGPGS